jgi:putative transposase
MSEYRRLYLPQGVYFFTLVTYQRKPIFNNANHIDILRKAFTKIKKTQPFTMDAIVILPDHLHCIWRLPENDHDYSGRWREIKKSVSKAIHPITNERGECLIWQRRFWEHAIRDEEDWRRHLDYIHFNPVKHGYANSPNEWPWSSFDACVKKGWYDRGWGRKEPDDIWRLELE